MKQIHYTYTGREELKDRLGEIRAESNRIGCRCILVHIYSTNIEYTRIREICDEIEKYLPEALYAGCTTNANILDGHVSPEGINLIISMFENPDAEVGLFQCNLEGSSVSMLLEVKRKLKEEYPEAAGVEILVSSYGMMHSNLTKVFAELRTSALIFGGGAYTGDRNADSYVFSKGNVPDSKALVFVIYGGSALHIITRSVTGWKALGRDFEITSAEGNLLKQLDGKPAFDIYSNYLNIDNNDYFEDNAIEFPVMCRTAEGEEIMRTPISSYPDGTIVMFSEVDVFQSVRLAYGDRTNIIKDIGRVAEDIAEFRPNAISIFSCVARRAFWHEDADRESVMFQSIAPTSGFFTSGEILSHNNRIYHHNETLVIVGMREGDVDESIPMPVIPNLSEWQSNSLNNRLVQFITTATEELEETNRSLDKLIYEVDESRRQAEAANRAKSDFLANMSHEIRTPINAILGFDTMILRESGNEAIIKYATNIQRSGLSLLTIINEILDLSKIESGKMTIVPVEYELNTLILDIVNMIGMKAGDKGLRLNLDVDRGLPSKLYGDDVRIRQIVVNLMNNAVKYTESGSVTLAVNGRREGGNAVLEIEVRDTGIGIKPEDMDKLFEKFSRIEEARNHQVEGSGLGMNITVSLLSMMNSKLKVRSEYGKGSVFGFEIVQGIVDDSPVGEIHEKAIRNTDETAYASSFTAPEAEILVVDDNCMNREVILALLKRTKIQFDEADGGLVCLEKTEKKKYDMILLDHMMPDLDGIKTLSRIRASQTNPNVNTPIICMTANAITGAKEEYIFEGFDSYISKPVKPDMLEKTIAEYLPAEKVLMEQEIQESLVQFHEEVEAAAQPELPVIDGIDNEVALENLQTPELVLTTMKIFVDSAESEAGALMNFYDVICANESEDAVKPAVADYRIKVHAMKSSALTIGGVMVSNMAKFLEYSARDNRTDNIRKVTVPFVEEWIKLSERVAPAVKVDEPEEEPEEFNPEWLVRMLSELDSAIREMDIDRADELLAKIKKFDLPEAAGDAMKRLEAAVTNIDVAGVADITLELIQIFGTC